MKPVRYQQKLAGLLSKVSLSHSCNTVHVWPQKVCGIINKLINILHYITKYDTKNVF